MPRGLDRDDLIAIGFAGVLGATLRWALTRSGNDGDWFEYAPDTSVTFEPSLPTAVLAANLLGCLLLGGLTVLLARGGGGRPRRVWAAAVGFCGSLTTFSTFATDMALLLRAEGDRPTAATYLFLSLFGGAAAFWVGRSVTRRLAL